MKRTLGILLCIALFCGLMPCAALADNDPITLSSCEAGEVSVSLNCPAKRLIAAAYRNGQLAGCDIKSDCAPGTHSFSLPESYRYKVFALDDSGVPICEALEIKDPSSVILREETDVPLPTLDDSVASALGAAVSEYAKVSLALQQLQTAFADAEDLENLRENHDLYLRYNQMLSDTVEALGDVMPALTALDAVTQKQMDELSGEVSLLSCKLMGELPPEEVVSWAKELSEKFDAYEGNSRMKRLAKDIGCDVKTAYTVLSAAQEILYESYTASADCFERWEKAMVALKATSKVSFYVCATAATAGAASIAAVPAALTTGTVTAGEAAGIMIGAADVGLELGMDSAKIIIGGNSAGDKVIQRVEDRLKPVTDGLLLYSLCTLSNSAEKLAFLGDIGQRGKELYDSITVKQDEQGNLEADMVRLNNSDPSAAAEVAKEKGIPTGEDKLGESMEAEIKDLETAHGKDREELTELLRDEGIIETDGELNTLVKEYNNEIVEEINRKPDPDRPRQRIEEYYNSQTGELNSIACYDSDGRRVWERYYDSGKVRSYVSCEWDGSGDLIQTWTHYYQDPETGIYTNQIEWIEKSRLIGGSYSNEKVIDHLSYNENGTIAEHTWYDAAGNYHSKQYDGNGQISLDTTTYPDRVYELSYYTSNDPNVPHVDRIGHLQHEYEYPRIPENEMFVSVYTVREEWTAVKVSNYSDKLNEYGWNHSVWNGSSFESAFTPVYSEPMPEG